MEKSNLDIAAEKILRRNLIKGETNEDHPTEYTYICPDVEVYPHQWLWDSCFHIIVNSTLNLEHAKAEFETILKRQYPNGFVAHMNYWTEKQKFVDKIVQRYYKNKKTSSITQTPVLAQSLRSIYNATKEKKYLERYLPDVLKYFDYLYKTRIFENNDIKLLHIVHSWEAGIDNSPIYDKALNIDTTKSFLTFRWGRKLLKQLKELDKCDWNIDKIAENDYFCYKDLLFNCVFIQGYRDLAFLHEELNSTTIANVIKKRANDLEESLLKNCWNPDIGLFFGLYGKENTMCEVKSEFSLIPLILDGLPQNYAAQLVEDHLMNENEFWTKYPIPSVAINEPSYSEKNNRLLWRGPIWININWYIIQGLRKHGFENEAIELAKKTFEVVKKNGFREFYSPTSGKGMGAKYFGWSTLVVDIEKRLKDDELINFIFNREWLKVKRMDF